MLRALISCDARRFFIVHVLLGARANQGEEEKDKKGESKKGTHRFPLCLGQPSSSPSPTQRPPRDANVLATEAAPPSTSHPSICSRAQNTARPRPLCSEDMGGGMPLESWALAVCSRWKNGQRLARNAAAGGGGLCSTLSTTYSLKIGERDIGDC